MGKIKRFEVVYSNDSGVFYAGQPIAGKIILELKEPLKAKGVKIRCQGELYVSFTDPSTKKRHTERHSYFDHTDTIFTADQPLDAGIHEYAFSFTFNAPGVLPSSFESQYGHVRFWSTAYLNLPLLSRDQSTRKPFSLVSIVDLNNEPLAFTPGYGHRQCRFSFADRLLCCVSGGLTGTVKLPRCAFVPGEQMVIHADVTNNSTKRVKRVEAFVQQNVIYSTAKGGRRWVKGEAKIAQLTQGPVTQGESQEWNESVTIPPLPPTKLGGCQQIAVDYMFNFVIYVDGAEDIRLTVPLVIGTVPLHQAPLQWLPPNATQPPEPPQYSPAPRLDRLPSACPSAPPPEQGYEGPPPSYEECMYNDGVSPDVTSMAAEGEQFEADVQTGAKPYRPLYPTYATLAARPGTSATRLIESID
uniref:Arrestin C-terminal-like domain-containing protein n=1 Tax=Plectus sambesii TaxID=2011161 RepID=A0A914XTQ6_9BILA